MARLRSGRQRGSTTSDTTAPFDTSGHPYLVAGHGRVDGWVLELPADIFLDVTPDRLVPTAEEAVDASYPRRFDFREPRRIADARIDHAFTGLRREQGIARVRLTDASGAGVSMACAFNSENSLIYLDPGSQATRS